ncbi:hypothetical protein PHK61_26485 [Actinomycetospora lutea]|uniref:hypothetical protein n=1 Tax=Actinomycetospora lutea TaxID=663604 RepID=UPI0023672477|nr:hypothetical protein [Actinomycetospora lutea]MDD7941968.1 hypothetical protein [Actinomycetospora lutea]
MTDIVNPATVTTTVETTELRVHGVHGTPPSVLLGDPFPQQVAGDSDARFYRGRGVTGNPTREAFWWSRMTSGSALRAFWLLFLPFALVNLARYALLTWDDARDGEAPADRRHPWDRLAGGLLRLTGAVLSLGLVTTTFGVSADLIIRQCGFVITCRTGHSWLNWMGAWEAGPVVLLAVVPAALVLGLFELIGRETFVHSSPGARPTWADERRFGNQEFWREAAEITVLRRLHLAACAAIVGVLTTSIGTAYGSAMIIIGIVLLVATLVLIAIRDVGRTRVVAAIAAGLAAVYAVVAVGLVAAARWSAPLASQQWEALPGTLERATDLIGESLAGLLLLLVLVVGVQSRRFRQAENHAAAPNRPPAFRPMWGGLAPAVLVSLGIGVFCAYATGIVFAVADVLGTVRPAQAAKGETLLLVGSSYWSAAIGALVAALVVTAVAAPLAAWVLGRRRTAVWWSVTSAALAVGIAVIALVDTGLGELCLVVAGVSLIAGVVAWIRGGRRPLDGETGRRPDPDYPNTPPPPSDVAVSTDEALDRVWRAWLMGRAKYRYRDVAGFLAGVAGATIVAGGAGAAARRILGGGPTQPTTDDQASNTVAMAGAAGAALAGALLLALLSLGITSYRSQAVRTTVGVAWDLISFWPRLVHPLCPPPYGGRAVIETARRAVDLVGAGRRTRSVVVLSGHSQGSVICMAAATLLAARAEKWDPISQRPPAPPGHQSDITLPEARRTITQLALLTYGSQLQWAFPRLFPCFIGFHHLRRLYERGVEGRWRSLYRETDPLGGRVLSWGDGPADRLERPGQPFLTEEQIGAAQRWGPDVRLKDPVSLTVSPDHVRPQVSGHSGYYDDPAFENVLGEVAEEAGATPWPTPRAVPSAGDGTASAAPMPSG